MSTDTRYGTAPRAARTAPAPAKGAAAGWPGPVDRAVLRPPTRGSRSVHRPVRSRHRQPDPSRPDLDGRAVGDRRNPVSTPRWPAYPRRWPGRPATGVAADTLTALRGQRRGHRPARGQRADIRRSPGPRGRVRRGDRHRGLAAAGAVARLLPASVQDRWLTPSLPRRGAPRCPELVAQVALPAAAQPDRNHRRDPRPAAQLRSRPGRRPADPADHEPLWATPADHHRGGGVAARVAPGRPDGATSCRRHPGRRSTPAARRAIASIQSTRLRPTPPARRPPCQPPSSGPSPRRARRPRRREPITTELNPPRSQLPSGVHLVKPSSGTTP